MFKALSLVASAAWLILLSTQAWAATCADELTGHQLSLPRDLKVSESAAQYLMTSAEHSEFLLSISRVFLALNKMGMDLSDLGVELSEGHPSHFAELDLSQNDFFKKRPLLISPEVQRNFLVLSQTPLVQELNSADLGLLAYIWRKTPHNQPGQSLALVLDRAQVAEQMLLKYNRIQHLLSMPQFRQALIAMIGDEEGRAHYLKLFTAAQRMSRYKTGYLHPDDLDQTSRDLARGKALKRDALMNINRFMDSFGIEISMYSIHELGLQSASLDGPTMTYYRDEFLLASGPFFAERLHLKSHLNEVTSLIDHLFFGSALPWNSQQLHQNALEEIKTLLLPLKSEYRDFQAQELKQQEALLKAKSAGPFQLKLMDLFAPKVSVHIRNRAETGGRAERESLADFESLISPDESLRPFTSFSEKRASIAGLVPLQTYKFWFLRESEPRLQRVRFSESVVEWINGHPELAMQLLNALHLGRARSVGQSGIKILNFLSSSRYDGSVFELKTSNGYRGLLLNVDGIWEFVGVADKDAIHRAVDSLVPLPR